jgi:hypothetical protein
MKRIFTAIWTVNMLGLFAAFGLGAVSWLRGSLANPDDPTYFLHFQAGLYSVIFNLGVHSTVFIYFLGTGRWVKEVAAVYSLPDALLPRLTRDLKRRAFPPALFAMLVPIGAAAAGQAVQMQVAPWFLHGGLALLTIAVNVWAFRIERQCIETNLSVLDQVLAAVDRIRAERGLPSNADALRQQNA